MKKLYNRRMDCGHWRPTTIAFMVGDYKKPSLNGICFCRECNRETRILEVVEMSEEEVKRQEAEEEEEITCDCHMFVGGSEERCQDCKKNGCGFCEGEQ